MDDSITVPQHAVSPPAACRTAALPSPCEDVAALFAPEEMKMLKLKIESKQTSKHLLQKYFLHDRRGGVIAASPGEIRRVLLTTGTRRPGILLGMASTSCSLQTTGLKKRSGSCSFIWLSRWGRAAVKKGEETEGKGKSCNKNTRYGPDWGAPPPSSCMLSEPHLSNLKGLPLLATRPPKMDERQGGGWNAGKSGESWMKAATFLLSERQRPRLLVCTRPHGLDC